MSQITIYVKEATDVKTIQSLETNLLNLNGIERALVDVEDGEVKISYNEGDISKEQLLNMIEQHGLHILS